MEDESQKKRLTNQSNDVIELTYFSESEIWESSSAHIAGNTWIISRQTRWWFPNLQRVVKQAKRIIVVDSGEVRDCTWINYTPIPQPFNFGGGWCFWWAAWNSNKTFTTVESVVARSEFKFRFNPCQQIKNEDIEKSNVCLH